MWIAIFFWILYGLLLCRMWTRRCRLIAIFFWILWGGPPAFHANASINCYFLLNFVGGKVAVYIPSREAYENCYFLLNFVGDGGASADNSNGHRIAIFFWILSQQEHVDATGRETARAQLLFSFEFCLGLRRSCRYTSTMTVNCYFLLNFVGVVSVLFVRAYFMLLIAIFFWILSVVDSSGQVLAVSFKKLLFSFEFCDWKEISIYTSSFPDNHCYFLLNFVYV